MNINGNEVRLQIWDLVGMDTNFAGINKSFCRNSSGAIFVGDLTDTATIEILAEWKAQVEEIIAGVETPIPMVLCGNKCDMLFEQERSGE